MMLNAILLHVVLWYPAARRIFQSEPRITLVVDFVALGENASEGRRGVVMV
jgi:hypothetical protein